MMGDISNCKDWPTLNESAHTPATAAGRGKSAKDKNKKQNGKTKWSSFPIDSSLNECRSQRHFKESKKSSEINGRNRNNTESNNVASNGPEISSVLGFTVDTRRLPRVAQDVPIVLDVNEECVCESRPFSNDVELKVMRQIEYYFSEINLRKDKFLRINMDEQGYVELALIATFPRIKDLTHDFKLILEAVKKSYHLEVSNEDKVRPVVDPLRWPLKEVIEETAGNYATQPNAGLLGAQYNGLYPNIYPHLYHPVYPSIGYIPFNFIRSDQHQHIVYFPVNFTQPIFMHFPMVI